MPRGRPKKIIEEKTTITENCCLFSNPLRDCKKVYLCCAFCGNEKCKIRCCDDYKNCKYKTTSEYHKISPYKETKIIMKKGKKI